MWEEFLPGKKTGEGNGSGKDSNRGKTDISGDFVGVNASRG